MSLAALSISEAKNEIRERCSETTHAKFVSLETQLHDAMKEGVTDEESPALQVAIPESAVQFIREAVVQQVDTSIRAVHAEFMAAQPSA